MNSRCKTLVVQPKLYAAVALIVGLSACAGMNATPNEPAGYALSRNALPGTGRALITITVPTQTAADEAATQIVRRPSYVSGATKGMTISFRRSGKVAAKQVVSLTSGSPGCAKAAAGTKCTFSISLKACPAGRNCYLAGVVTYDAVSCKGNPASCSIPAKAHQLSTEQKYPVGIRAMQTTTLSLTLAGIPVSTKAVPADALTRVNGDAFDLIGPGAHAIVVEYLDADGETIVGSGSPSLELSRVTGGLAPVIVGRPDAGSNQIYVTPPGIFDGSDTAAFSVTPSFAGQATNGCKAPNAKCTPVKITIDMVRLAAIAGANLQLYALGDAVPAATLEGGVGGVAADAAGNLYTGYEPPGGDPGCQAGAPLGAYVPPQFDGNEPKAIACGTVAIDQVPNQTAYVLLANSPYGRSTAFCSNAACTTSLDVNYLNNAVAADGAGDVAANIQITTSYNCQVLIGATQYVQLSGALPCAQSMVFDSSGNLFATVPSSMQVVELSKSSYYSTQTTVSTSPNIPYELAVDGNGNVLIAGQNPGTLAATLQESLATTLSANQSGSIAPDHTITLATPAAGQGTAFEALTTAGETAYVQLSFVGGSTGSFAAYALPGLTQIGTAVTNGAVGPTGMLVLP